jgi:phosphoglycolate phosphatase-like HAD superfamily hydrolase
LTALSRIRRSLDAEIYLQSLSEVFGFVDVSSEWSSYQHTTDSGILGEIFQNRLGRAPAAAETSAFRTHFVNAIAAAAQKMPFREIPGARQLLSHLIALQPYRVGLATGGWSDTARCKMLSAGMPYDAVPSASADDAVSRVSIMQIAIDRVVARADGHRPDSVVYVGDGIWDARACRALTIPFVGIATGAHAQTLRAEGAVEVFPDYSEMAAFCTALTLARQPFENVSPASGGGSTRGAQ